MDNVINSFGEETGMTVKELWDKVKNNENPSDFESWSWVIKYLTLYGHCEVSEVLTQEVIEGCKNPKVHSVKFCYYKALYDAAVKYGAIS